MFLFLLAFDWLFVADASSYDCVCLVYLSKHLPVKSFISTSSSCLCRVIAVLLVLILFIILACSFSFHIPLPLTLKIFFCFVCLLFYSCSSFNECECVKIFLIFSYLYLALNFLELVMSLNVDVHWASVNCSARLTESWKVEGSNPAKVNSWPSVARSWLISLLQLNL